MEQGASSGIIHGLPMVSNDPSISPDGKLFIVDGADACINARYDHQDCPLVPAHIFHIFRAADRQLLRSMFYPPPFTGPARFVDNSRYLVLGSAAMVFDGANYTLLGKTEGGEQRFIGDAIRAQDGRRMYVGSYKPNGIVILQMENAECGPQQQGLELFYSADGTFEDAANSWNLTPHGGVSFAPGRVGQSFYLDGSGTLSTASTGHYTGASRDISLALYAKPEATRGEQILIDWTTADAAGGVRLTQSEDRHFVFEARPRGIPMKSKTSIVAGTWYNVAVTKTERQLTLYVNGVAEAIQLQPRGFDVSRQPLFLGGSGSGQPSFRGLLYEISFYERALTDTEVYELYRMRESGPCKM